ncbi:MAG: CinA family protein [Spirochaetes bacterium]|nr:CinA family protein [Spirochaetota bacterium]
MNQLIDRKETIGTAESCTGGLIGSLITEISGSSKTYWGGVITYSNEAKVKLLGVPERVLLEKGAVSKETVTLMAQRMREMGNTHWGIGVSGIAGPMGGSTEKPVGTVYIALAGTNGYLRVERFHFKGARQEIRIKASLLSLLLLESCVCQEFDIDIERLNAYI